MMSSGGGLKIAMIYAAWTVGPLCLSVLGTASFAEEFSSGSSCPSVLMALQELRSRPAVAAPSPDAPDPQRRIWDLRAQGRGEDARKLEAELARYLSEAPITKKVRHENASTALSRPVYVTLEDGTEAIWKSNSSEYQRRGAELSAYLVDRELGLDWVPTTVERELNGVPGTLQVRVQGVNNAVIKEGRPAHLALFDYLLSNHDRHKGNFLVLGNGAADRRVAAIDHGLSFDGTRTFKIEPMLKNPISRLRDIRSQLRTFEEQAAFSGRNGEREMQASFERAAEKLRRELALERSRATSEIADFLFPLDAFRKLQSLSDKDWQKLLGMHVDYRRVVLFIERKNNVIRLVEEARRELGDAIFPEKNRTSLLTPSAYQDR